MFYIDTLLRLVQCSGCGGSCITRVPGHLFVSSDRYVMWWLFSVCGGVVSV